jgi:hypothetical protein
MLVMMSWTKLDMSGLNEINYPYKEKLFLKNGSDTYYNPRNASVITFGKTEYFARMATMVPDIAGVEDKTPYAIIGFSEHMYFYITDPAELEQLRVWCNQNSRGTE